MKFLRRLNGSSNSGRAAAFGVILLSFSLAAGCRRSAAESAPPPSAKTTAAEAPPVEVKIVPTHEVKVPRILTLSGSLIGSEESNVAAGAAGKILSTYVERGSVVKKGQVLVRLDARALTAQ